MRTILFAIATLQPGGAERVIVTLANAFADEQGYRVYLVTADSETDPVSYSVSNMVNLIRMDTHRVRGRLRRARICIKTTRGLTQIVQEVKPDVVIAFLNNMEIPAFITGKRTHTKTYTSLRASTEGMSVSRRMFVRLVWPRLDGVVFQTNVTMHYKTFKHIKKKTVIMNPLVMPDDDSIVDAKERNDWIVNIGRLHPVKNQKLLVQAFESIAEDNPLLELHIYGQGELRDELQRQIDNSSYRDRMFLEGVTENPASKAKKAKMFVLSSDREGFPNALVEAMAYGIPAICTDFDSGAAADLIEDKVNGCLCPCGDVEKMAASMRYILALDGYSMNQMSKAESQVRAKLDVNKIRTQWEAFLFGE